MSAAVTPPASPVAQQVRATCTQLPAAAYGNPPDDFGNVNGGAVLYECTPAG